MGKLEGRVALVTGGNSGIGLAKAWNPISFHHAVPYFCRSANKGEPFMNR